MGTSYQLDDTPRMCFNAAKTWQLSSKLGWYTPTYFDTLNRWSSSPEVKEIDLVGVSEFEDISEGQYLVVRATTATGHYYFINFNRQSGANEGTQEGANQVLVVKSGDGYHYAKSYLVEKLNSGGIYIVNNVGGEIIDQVIIQVLSINLGTTPAVARIKVELYGMQPTEEPLSCPYLSCLRGLLEKNKSRLDTFNNRALDKLALNVFSKTTQSLNQMENGGDAIASLNNLRQAMTSIQLFEIRAKRLGKNNAVEFSNDIGKSGSTCAIDSVDHFIAVLKAEGSVSEKFLQRKPTKLLRQARKKMGEGKWEESVSKSLEAVIVILKKLGGRKIDICNA